MINYTKLIEEIVKALPINEIIEANKLHVDVLKDTPETIFYKVMQRMSDNGDLVHLTKGLYFKPKKTKFGNVPISENDIIKHYIRDSSGLCVGYSLYNKKGITTQIPATYKVLSNRLVEDIKTIKNVEVRRINLELTNERVSAIEILEILQNYNEIEDANPYMLGEVMKSFAESYNDEETKYVLDNLKYKKSTIASLKEFLNYLSVENGLGKYLSTLSAYKTIDVRGIYESAL